jgi:hypothetical protein
LTQTALKATPLFSLFAYFHHGLLAVTEPVLQIWEGQIERKKIGGQTKKINKIKGKILFYFIIFYFFWENILGVGGASPHIGSPLALGT